MKNIRQKLALLLALAMFATSSQAHAALNSVSGKPLISAPNSLTEIVAAGNPADVAVSLATGFPIWYKDTAAGLKLELCTDTSAVKQTGGAAFSPCLFAPPFAGSPASFPNNFPAEAFYWVASAFSNTLTASVNGQTPGWNALLVMAQEAAFVDGIATEGSQAVFSRIRLRISVPVSGTYRVTHPFGTRVYVIPAATGIRDINQTQDIGLLATENFLTSLGDRPADQLPLPGFPEPTQAFLNFVPNGLIDSIGNSIGPFLPSPANQVLATNGSVYLSDPGTDLAPIEVPIINGPFGNAFTIELIGDALGGPVPAGVFLNSANNSQIVSITNFQLAGKIFNEGANLAPVALPITLSTQMNTSVSVDVAGAVTDTVNSVTNVHGLNPQAIGIFVTPNDIRRSSPFTTANNGTVQRFTNISTGKTTFTYTPATGFTGVDTFQYVIQDTGGLISAQAQVSITVEDLAVAAGGAYFRPKFGKWNVNGISSSTSNNTISLFTDPSTTLSGVSEVPPVVSAAKGSVSVVAAKDNIKFFLDISPLPASAITAVHLHYGTAAQNGPILFDLYDNLDGPISLPLTGQLTQSQLQPRQEINIVTMQEAVNAILSGNTYVNVHTAGNPSGEMRGQLTGRSLGSAVVGQDGTWKFSEKSTINPLPVRGLNAVSSNGVRIFGIPLSIR